MSTIFPLEPFLEPLANNPWTYVVFLAIGFGFGYVLEISGFGQSTKLAAQFYFKDLTVLKVMFTAIVTAMVLVFLSSAIGILDFNLVYVPETHLWPGILGGVIMGLGFVIGGFCPGTSIVSAATLKIDGMVFIAGAAVGVWAFGETVQSYWDWWNQSGYFGRVTLMDAFNLSTGWVVLLVTFMALFMFWGGEQLERIIGKRDMSREPKLRLVGAGLLVVAALAVLLIGQPTAADKWSVIAADKTTALQERKVQIHPGELLHSLADPKLDVLMLDVRSEADFNLFHLEDSRNVALAEVNDLIPDLIADMPANRLIVLMSNDETAATEAWKLMQAGSVLNAYILEGGINYWIATFGATETGILPIQASIPDDMLRYSFAAALGDRYEACAPSPHEWELEYQPKIELKLQRSPSGGGCG
ncbi:YeeE/YedE thiosulfate transporter family protein [Chloroflexota bacterium]